MTMRRQALATYRRMRALSKASADFSGPVQDTGGAQ